MPFHRLLQVTDPPLDKWWELEWDANRLRLTDPAGFPAIDGETATMHRVIDLERLLDEALTFKSPHSIIFKPNPEAAADVLAFVRRGIRNDPGFLAERQRPSWRGFWIALVVTLVCAGLFGGYCWWASTSTMTNPPPWLSLFGGLIHLILAVLMAMSIAGPIACGNWLSQILRTRRTLQRILAGP